MRLYSVEVGARGFVRDSMMCWLKDLGQQGERLHQGTREVSNGAIHDLI